MDILLIILSILIGICIIGFVYFLKKNQALKLELAVTAAENKKQEKLNSNIIEQNEANLIILSDLQQKKEDLLIELKEIEVEKEKEAANLYQQKQAIGESLSNAAEDMAEKFAQAQQECCNEYGLTLEECQKELSQLLTEKTIELNQLDVEIEEARKKVSTIIEESKRREGERIKKDFYRLILSPKDVEEIKTLRQATALLRNAEPMNKVIWKVYYEKPYTDLIGRVVGSNARTGIYKITNLENNMCYVGQAVDIASRWKQHIKRGLGAETPTRNKLYPAMLEFGVENFSFEILEECKKESLDSLEDYWQDFYKAKEFGYSIK